jgi:hypothetical protein
MSFLIRFLIVEATRFVSPPAVAAEWVIVLLAAAVVAFAPGRLARWFRPVRDGFRRIAGVRRLAVLICGVLPVAVRLAMLGIVPPPEPSIHDEFSHLLLADTLAHGRLTNPTHPMWRHFETIHVIQKPTYNSMYPPGQGAFLALGEAVFHKPWAGVLISVGLMFAAMCWMMQGWLPPAWAFFGTLTAILKFGITGIWIDSYLGGAVSGIGGALLIGSLPRLKRDDSRPFHAFLFGVGMAILMNTRPFEGAVLSAAALMYLAPSLLRRVRKHPIHVVKTVLWPAGAVLLCGVLFTGFYSLRVTGSPFRMPYQVNRDTYGWPENLGFLAPKKVVLRDPVLKEMYAIEVRHHEIYSAPDRFIDNLGVRLFDNWTFFIGGVLTVPLLFLPWVLRDRRIRSLLLFLAVIAVLNLFQMVLYPYHLGPVVPVIFAIVAQCMRHLYVTLGRASASRAVAFVLAVPVCAILVGTMKQNADDLGLPLAYWERGYEGHRDARAEISAWLAARPRKQLAVVRYASWHSPNQEWVYNHADIDGSKVVWAREMDPESDARLLEYFSNREAWLLEADRYPLRVVPYPLSERLREPFEP